MAADVEEKALVARRAGDAADIDRVLLQNEDGVALFGERVARGQTAGPAPMTSVSKISPGSRSPNVLSPMSNAPIEPTMRD
jgi:hypothetical protein